ncbi:RelA/SpoT family protein [Desulfobulbus oralis]|uniref:GTP pyrophosphokinase n=1 Tax=Desulfobulbus oralis TaxID=1986146 RepID=A0A2L1GR93_9BACT|nr:HD domain-containing protein [Desulfobulbus oralis]AVD72170.1 GTP pyrophosphokinase [Desulfobulbus oralis]
MQHGTFDIEDYRQSMAAIIGLGPETRVFWSALDFACDAHKNQRRRSGDPYIMHPCLAAQILAAELDIRSPEMLAAALLHDTIEDVKGVDSALLTEKFGPDVAAIVEGCTKVTNFTGGRQTFKKLVHRKIFSGAAARLEVMLVKLADRLHNMRTLKSMPRDKRQKIADETLDIYAPLATILGLFDIKRELYNLALTHKFPRQCKPIRAHIRELLKNPDALDIVNRIRAALAEKGLKACVELRTRELWAYYDMHHHMLMQRIETPQTIVILTEDLDSCYTALGVVNGIYAPSPRSIRDFIASPKPTGYQCLHCRPIIGGRKYLFKIRTEEMQRRARRGMVRDWTMGSRASTRFFKQIQEMFDILGRDESLSYRDLIAAGDRKEIYTYTPKGDLICLPVNSIALDFAFRIHSAIGLSCTGAMIGQQKVPASHVLQDGNVVRILRQDEPVVFDQEVQSLCQTPQARAELSKTFRIRREDVSRQIGASVLQQELRRYGIPREVLDKDMSGVLDHFGLPDMPALYLALGENRVRLPELVAEIRDRLYAGHPTLVPPTGILNQVTFSTVDPVVMKVSACCHPSPLDRGIIGLLSERGLSLHRKECPQLARIDFQREDAVEVRWQLSRTPVVKLQKLIVMQATKSALLTMLAKAPEIMAISEVVHLGSSDRDSAWEISFRISTLLDLKKIMRHLEHSGLVYEFELDM